MELPAWLQNIKYLNSAMQQTRNPAQLPPCLIRVFKDEVFALLQLSTDVDHAAQDAPGVLHAQVNLAGKLVGLELLCSQDDMPR